jgi:hypothetical protein
MPFVEFKNKPLDMWEISGKTWFEHCKVEKKLIEQKRKELKFLKGISKEKGKGKTKPLGNDNSKINYGDKIPGNWNSPRASKRVLALRDKQALDYKNMWRD